MKYIGFYKNARNPSRARQEKLLADYDLWETIDDDADAAVMLIHKGRAIVVAQLGLLGRVGPSLQSIIRRVHDRGGHIVEAATGRESCNPADAAAMGMDALQRRKITREQARVNAKRFDDTRFEAALDDWRAGVPRDELAARLGVSVSTLVRRMREVGAEPRKGGRPKQKTR